MKYLLTITLMLASYTVFAQVEPFATDAEEYTAPKILNPNNEWTYEDKIVEGDLVTIRKSVGEVEEILTREKVDTIIKELLSANNRVVYAKERRLEVLLKYKKYIKSNGKKNLISVIQESIEKQIADDQVIVDWCKANK